MPRTRYKSYHIIHTISMIVGVPFLGALLNLVLCGFPQAPCIDPSNDVVNPEHVFVISKSNIAEALNFWGQLYAFMIFIYIVTPNSLRIKYGINSKGIRRMEGRWLLFPPRISFRCKSWDQAQDITVRKELLTAYMSWSAIIYFKRSGIKKYIPFCNNVWIGIDNKSLPKLFEEIKKYAPKEIWQKTQDSYNKSRPYCP